MSHPALARCAPRLAEEANGFDAVEAALTAYEEEIARLTKERDEALATVKRISLAHNETLAKLAELAVVVR